MRSHGYSSSTYLREWYCTGTERRTVPKLWLARSVTWMQHLYSRLVHRRCLQRPRAGLRRFSQLKLPMRGRRHLVEVHLHAGRFPSPIVRFQHQVRSHQSRHQL